MTLAWLPDKVAAMVNLPKFESEFLEDVAFAFRKRRKSLKHRGSGINLSKVYELVEDVRMERLEIYLEHWTQVLRLHAWPDRMIWLGVHQATKKTYAWNWTYEGRLLGAYEPQRIVAALEETHDLLHRMNKERTEELSGPWRALLARGPIEVR